MCVHIIFISVTVAEWPPFGKIAAHSVDHTVQSAKRLYPSRLRTWNFASHVTFLRGFCVEVAWVLRGISEKVA